MYDPARIHERYGLAPRQMIDFKALKGDTTDNIPGLAGRGRQDRRQAARGLRLARRRLRAHRRGQARQAAREAASSNRDDVLLWRDLVTIDRHAPIAAGPGGRTSGRLRPRGGASACSGSTSSGRSWSGCRAVEGEDAPAPGRPAARGGPGRAGARGAGAPAGSGAWRRPAGGGQRAAAEPRLRCRRRRRHARSRSRAASRTAASRAPRSSPDARGRARPCSRRCWRSVTRLERFRPATTWPPGSRRSRSSTVGRRVRRSATPSRHAARASPSRGADGRMVAADDGGRARAGGGGHRRRQAARRATTSSRCSSGSWRAATRRAASSLSAERRLAAARRVRHPDRGVHPQRRPAQPVARGHQRRAAGHRAAARRASCAARSTRPCQALAAAAARESLVRTAGRTSPVCSASSTSWSCRSSRCSRTWRRPASPSIVPRLGELVAHLHRRRSPGCEQDDLRIGRPRVHARQPQAARAGAVLRAEPAARQAHQDRLLHRRVRARGPARRRTR